MTPTERCDSTLQCMHITFQMHQKRGNAVIAAVRRPVHVGSTKHHQGLHNRTPTPPCPLNLITKRFPTLPSDVSTVLSVKKQEPVGNSVN